MERASGVYRNNSLHVIGKRQEKASLFTRRYRDRQNVPKTTRNSEKILTTWVKFYMSRSWRVLWMFRICNELEKVMNTVRVTLTN